MHIERHSLNTDRGEKYFNKPYKKNAHSVPCTFPACLTVFELRVIKEEKGYFEEELFKHKSFSEAVVLPEKDMN